MKASYITGTTFAYPLILAVSLLNTNAAFGQTTRQDAAFTNFSSASNVPSKSVVGIERYYRLAPILLALWLLPCVSVFATPNFCPTTITSVVVNPLCYGETASISVTTTGGQSPYTYQWADGSTTPSIVGLAAGAYFVTSTDANGCIATARFNIQQPEALQVRLTPTHVTCGTYATGTATAIISGGKAPYTYSWSTGDTSSIIRNQRAGVYTIRVLDANNCSTAAQVLIQNPTLQYSVGSIFLRCDQLPTNQRLAVSVYLSQLPPQYIDGIDIKFPKIQGLNLVEVRRDTALDTVAVSRLFTTVNGVSSIAIFGNTTMRGRSIIRDTGRLATLIFELDNSFLPNTLHNLSLNIWESFEVGGRKACTGLSTIRIDGNQLVSVVNMVGIDATKLLIKTAVPTSVSSYTNTGLLLNTYSPDTRGRFNLDKTNVSFMEFNRTIADTVLMINTINSADVIRAFSIIAGEYSFTSDWRTHLSADVDGDGRIDAGDLTKINKRAVMILRHFPYRNGNRDWIAITDAKARRFDRQQFSATNLPQISSNGAEKLELAPRSQICQKDSISLHWILLGDVDNSWSNASVGLRSNVVVNLDICKAFKTNEGLAVPVSISNSRELQSLHFNWESRIKLVNVQSKLSNLAENHNRFEESNLVSSYCTTSPSGGLINDTTTVMNLILPDSDLKQSDFDSFNINVNGQTAQLKVNWQSDCVSSQKHFNASVFPNPTLDSYFSVDLSLPSSEIVEFKLFDSLGRLLWSRTIDPKSTHFQANFDTINQSDALYLLQIRQGSIYKTFKVINWVR